MNIFNFKLHLEYNMHLNQIKYFRYNHALKFNLGTRKLDWRRNAEYRLELIIK